MVNDYLAASNERIPVSTRNVALHTRHQDFRCLQNQGREVHKLDDAARAPGR
jgi:hypothetical protein